MTDREFILFLIDLLWNDVSDGDMPSDNDFDVIRQELVDRNIDPDNIMSY